MLGASARGPLCKGKRRSQQDPPSLADIVDARESKSEQSHLISKEYHGPAAVIQCITSPVLRDLV